MNLFKKIVIVFAILLSFGVFRLGGFFAVLGLWVFIYSFYQLITEQDRWVPIGEIALTMAGWQWIIAPMIAYSTPMPMFEMSQTCPEYMLKTVPMYCCFAIGYFSFRKSFRCDLDSLRPICLRNVNMAYTFIVIGLLFTLFPISSPLIAQFVKYLSELLFVGFLMLMIARPERSTLYLLIPLVLYLLLSLRGAMFHELLTWGIILALVWFNINRVSVYKRVLYIFIGLFIANSIQTIKASFREQVWNGYSGDKIALFVDLLINSSESTAMGYENGDNISRYNQGWIISMIYANVPKNHDYFYGRTYKDAVVATLLPRFLAPNKKGSGIQVQSDFREMTGYPLGDQTSMGLSVLGESYGNFGFWGGAFFMLFWGWFITRIMVWISNLGHRRCFLWFFMTPVIGFVLVEAEISMITVLNWTIKAFIFAFIVVIMSTSYLKR